ncbi:MAG: hypothetical protein M1834_002992 [Cirrosporium novae-zelandiae]|nr:MAG: hypothetical protein M1834_002992 [Cirrosporium novae-zelandiae]
MPSYFYHLAFELFPNRNQADGCPAENSGILSSNTSSDLIAALSPFRKPRKTGSHRVTSHPSTHSAAGSSSATGIPLQYRPKSQAVTSGANDEIRQDHDQSSNRYETYSRSKPSDIRLDNIIVNNIDMVPAKENPGHHTADPHGQVSRDIGVAAGGPATKGKYVPFESKDVDGGWGIIHLYRDAEETPGLYDDHHRKDAYYNKPGLQSSDSSHEIAFREDDCTTLCILAVPSYLTPSDFLGFVGEKTRDEVSHFRMIRTARTNRYMVLMKFRSPKKAREWRKEWNGKVFNSMEPETCHVVLVKSIELQIPDISNPSTSFPDMTNDPFTPSVATTEPSTGQPSSLVPSLSSKPLAPPTPSLVELPTCPVCLERMDETTGLLTILCQHVFHCTCLQKWKGSGCPVCRYGQDGLSKRSYKYKDAFIDNECSICHADSGLWICLICGNVGCGRYDLAHALAHYRETSHCFAMDMSTQRVWDYASDGYVHRILQNQSDGNMMELPAATANDPHQREVPDDYDFVPREKLDNIGLEYTHLLTSQLESQRAYFEEILERAADKASQASASASKASEAAEVSSSRLADLTKQYDKLANEIIPSLEKDRTRFEKRAEKFEVMARNMEKKWREENVMNENLMERIKFLDDKVKSIEEEKAAAETEREDLKEQNRDLSFFISGMDKLMDQGEDVVEGTVSVPDPPTHGKRKGKGRKK